MKAPTEKSDSLKKVLGNQRPFDEAEYYQSSKVEMGGEDIEEEIEEEEDEDDLDEEEEFYGDDD